jgi:hypothetical protein
VSRALMVLGLPTFALPCGLGGVLVALAGPGCPGIASDYRVVADQDWSYGISVGPPSRRLGVAWGTGNTWDGHGWYVYVKRFGTIRAVGWGWSGEHPLSVWPKFTDSPTPAGNRSRTLSWCGFLLQRFDAMGAA